MAIQKCMENLHFATVSGLKYRREDTVNACRIVKSTFGSCWRVYCLLKAVSETKGGGQIGFNFN